MPIFNKPQNNKPAAAKSTPNPKAESSEDWNGERQDNLQRSYYPQSPQYFPSYDIPDRFSQQYKLEKEWNERMKHLSDKYNLDYYSTLSLTWSLNQNTNMKP